MDFLWKASFKYLYNIVITCPDFIGIQEAFIKSKSTFSTSGWELVRLSNKSFKIVYFYFWQYIFDSLPLQNGSPLWRSKMPKSKNVHRKVPNHLKIPLPSQMQRSRLPKSWGFKFKYCLFIMLLLVPITAENMSWNKFNKMLNFAIWKHELFHFPWPPKFNFWKENSAGGKGGLERAQFWSRDN